jgi:LysR family glycine cleavage system transcriptional activator
MNANAKNSSADESGSSAPARRGLPPLKALVAFEAAARHGNFAVAGDELGVTPSAISHQIQVLEEFLGVKLFRRGAGRVALTDAGAVYAKEIGVALGLMADATSLVAPRARRSHLVVTAGPSLAAKWLQPRLSEFMAAHPDIRLRLSTLADVAALAASQVDVAITYGRPTAANMHVEPLLVERPRPLCSPVLAEALGLRAIRDLERTTIIHSNNTPTWAAFFRGAALPGLKTRDEVWIDRSTMAIEAAVGGLGVVLESEILAEQELRDGRLVAPFGDAALGPATVSYFLTYRIDAGGRRPVAAFAAWLRAAIPPANRAWRELDGATASVDER